MGVYASSLAFTTLWALLGPVLGNVDRWGFDLAFPAVFLVLMRSMWTSAGAALPWLVSLLVAAGVHLAVPGAWYVPAGAVAGIAFAWVRARS